MIYDKLRKLPKVIQLEIYETGDISLLTDENIELEDLMAIWEKLEEEFERKYNSNSDTQIFILLKEIEYQANRYTIINSCCEQLLFEPIAEIIEILRNQGYKFDENAKEFKSQLDKIHRESNAILLKIKQMQSKLPKEVTEDAKEKFSIIDVMASYAVVLGFSFDFNTCSVEAFHSYESQVKSKIKSLEKLANSNKKKS
jgi:hypothetical protein